MRLTRKQAYISAFVIALIGLIVWGFLPSAISVTADQAREAPLVVTIEEEGITRVTDRYTISAPVTGYVLRVPHEVGDSVVTGQELFQIQPAPDLISARQRDVAEAQLGAAQARLRQAEESLRLAREEKSLADTDLQRVQNLYADGIGSRQTLDNSQIIARRAAAQLASAEFSVSVAEHEVRAATSALQSFQSAEGVDQISIGAPIVGHLLKIHHKSEGTVQAGMPIMEIGDPASLEIRVDLLSTDAVRVRRGTRVNIKRWGADTTLAGIVKVVEPAGYTRISALGVEEQRVPVIVDIVSPRHLWRSLGDGYRVVAEFIIWQGDNVLQVPSSALFRSAGGSWSLFVVDDGRARLQTVDAGHQSGMQSQITRGLESGDLVITHPDERIETGVRVEVRD